MVAYNPEDRISIEEIAKHPWIKNETCTHSQIIAEFAERKKKVQKAEEEAQKIEEAKKDGRMKCLN